MGPFSWACSCAQRQLYRLTQTDRAEEACPSFGAGTQCHGGVRGLHFAWVPRAEVGASVARGVRCNAALGAPTREAGERGDREQAASTLCLLSQEVPTTDLKGADRCGCARCWVAARTAMVFGSAWPLRSVFGGSELLRSSVAVGATEGSDRSKVS